MKIVILDTYTINSDPKYWDPLKALGEVTVYGRTPAKEIVNRAADADIIILNKVCITAGIIERLPRLKYIGLTGTGYDHVDIEAAKKHNVVVTNAPGYGATSIAQHAFALLLQLTNRIDPFKRDLEWVRDEHFTYFRNPMVELYGKTIGILGWGATGRAMAKIAAGFGMKVLVHSKHATAIALGELTDIKSLFGRSDVVSIHVALTAETEGLVNKKLLNLMKPTAFLINTTRGAVIKEEDLIQSLLDNRIAGAGLDVLSKEPPHEDHKLIKAKNCIITPHISWITADAEMRLQVMIMENVKAFLAGKAVNDVTN